MQSRPKSITALDFLCATCQGHGGEETLAAALASRPDWDSVLTLAKRHRLLPALRAASQERPELPASIKLALNARFSSHTLRILRFTAELSAILQKFSAGGVEVILHKGPALAQRLYGDAAMREFGDLDLLVHPSDVARAATALHELGLRSRLRLSRRQEREYLRTGYEYVFGSDSEPNLVELQWQIAPRFYAVPFAVEDLFCRSVPFDFEGQAARTLGDEDLMLTLCVHAAKHCWSQLGMVRDIATLARQPLDWACITAEARRLGILRILTVSLVLGRNLMGLDLPHELASSAGRQTERIAKVVEERIRSGPELNPESPAYFRFILSLREKWRDRVRFAARLALTPSVGEWEAVRLPDGLFPLYYGVRVLRLVKRAF